MDELRRIQKVGYSSLTVSIPKSLARSLNLDAGDRVMFREETDGTIRLIPAGASEAARKVNIRVDQVGSDELLARLIVGSYALGYDAIEVSSKGKLDRKMADRAMETVRRLRGLEVVETQEDRILAQSFTDPTKFPVDSLIKRLQILVSKSLDNVIAAMEPRHTGNLNEVRRAQEEVDELYWLIVRQLLVALNRRDLAGAIGIESPLHAAGDRVTAKTLDEIGSITLGIAEELIRLRAEGIRLDPKVALDVRRLATFARTAFNTTVEGLLTPDIKLIEKSISLVNETLEIERSATRVVLSSEYAYARVLVSYFGQLARYCNIIIEIASHRLLRKSSRVATVEQLV